MTDPTTSSPTRRCPQCWEMRPTSEFAVSKRTGRPRGHCPPCRERDRRLAAVGRQIAREAAKAPRPVPARRPLALTTTTTSKP